MKSFSLRHGILLATLVVAAPGSSGAEAIASQRARLLREEFRYSPAIPAASEIFVAPVDEPVVALEVYRVTGSSAWRELMRKTAERESLQAARKFSWLRGGQLFSKQFGGRELELGLWPTIIPREVFQARDADVFLRVDLFRLNW